MLLLLLWLFLYCGFGVFWFFGSEMMKLGWDFKVLGGVGSGCVCVYEGGFLMFFILFFFLFSCLVGLVYFWGEGY